MGRKLSTRPHNLTNEKTQLFSTIRPFTYFFNLLRGEKLTVEDTTSGLKRFILTTLGESNHFLRKGNDIFTSPANRCSTTQIFKHQRQRSPLRRPGRQTILDGHQTDVLRLQFASQTIIRIRVQTNYIHEDRITDSIEAISEMARNQIFYVFTHF